MNGTVLLCTVGGSHEPILKAIHATNAVHVCFLCTGRDPATGKQGSALQVTGKGMVIKRHRDDPKPTLRNIPTQAGLDESRYDVAEIPADDLDECFLTISGVVRELSERFPSATLIADYTGGTKTMAAALVAAALESDGIGLQLVTGARPGIHRVKSGTEQALRASVTRLRSRRAMKRHLAAWSRFAYREAAHGLDEIRLAADSPDLRSDERRLAGTTTPWPVSTGCWNGPRSGSLKLGAASQPRSCRTIFCRQAPMSPGRRTRQDEGRSVGGVAGRGRASSGPCTTLYGRARQLHEIAAGCPQPVDSRSRLPPGG